MSTFLIKEGNHYHRLPPFSTYPWIGEQSMSRYVRFDASCEYSLPAYNALDVNKLFGLSFGFGGVHHNSARFGWRWNQQDNCIDLLAYCYVNGVRNQDAQLNFPVVAQIKLGEQVYCNIQYWEGAWSRPKFHFSVKRPDIESTVYQLLDLPDFLPKYGLTHGLYFGGTQTAPHDMKVEISKKPLD